MQSVRIVLALLWAVVFAHGRRIAAPSGVRSGSTDLIENLLSSGNLDPEDFEDTIDALLTNNDIPAATQPSSAPSFDAIGVTVPPVSQSPSSLAVDPIESPTVVSPSSPTQGVGNETTSHSAATTTTNNNTKAGLSELLEAYELTLPSLVKMFIGTYNPENPRDSDLSCTPQLKRADHNINCKNLPNYWVANVVTPSRTGVNGSLVNAVLYTNGHRSANSQRVLSFAGAFLTDDLRAFEPEGACLAAMYQYKNTEAEKSWYHACFESGFVAPDIASWAAQIEALVKETEPTVLTGHKLGCEFAKIQGILTGLPVICWSATGTLNPAWLEGYPGLKTAMEVLPKNPNMYVMQTRTDPGSNCILPAPNREEEGVANVCVYDANKRCDPYPPVGTNTVDFDRSPVSDCSKMMSFQLALFSRGLLEFDSNGACTAKENLATDPSWRDCPYEGYVPPTEPPVTAITMAAAAAAETTSGGSTRTTRSHLLLPILLGFAPIAWVAILQNI